MNALIVEKTTVDLKTGASVNQFAVATSDPIPLSVAYSLTFEGYLTRWTTSRTEVETTLLGIK